MRAAVALSHGPANIPTLMQRRPDAVPLTKKRTMLPV